MYKKRLLGICLIFLMVAFVFIQPAYGGPGGQIAKIIAKTFWGKMLPRASNGDPPGPELTVERALSLSPDSKGSTSGSTVAMVTSAAGEKGLWRPSPSTALTRQK